MNPIRIRRKKQHTEVIAPHVVPMLWALAAVLERTPAETIEIGLRLVSASIYNKTAQQVQTLSAEKGKESPCPIGKTVKRLVTGFEPH